MFGKWINHEFSSGCTTGRDFRDFSKEFKSNVKKRLPGPITLEKYNSGHYYLSGFLYNNKTNKWCYFSIMDVRGSRNEQVMIRTAKDERDFTGGRNNWIKFEEIGDMALSLTA